MALHIDRLNVERAGPLSELQVPLGRFNLIYGRNEQGKTFLVEFVIRCLFNHHEAWSLRRGDCRGKLLLSGLEDTPRPFMPSSKLKLDDLLLEAQPGLPVQLARLLVVKGAQLNFDRAASPAGAGISRAILKQLLSGQGVLDDIQGNISKTVQSASVEERRIEGHHRGEIRARQQLVDDLQQIDALFEALETTYSGGERRALEQTITELQEAIAQQELARRHQAYQTLQQIRQHEKRLADAPQDALRRLNDAFSQYLSLQQRIGRRQERLDELAQQSRHFSWLEEAITVYETRAVQGRTALSPLLPAAALALLLLAALSSFLQQPPLAVILILIAILIGWLALRRARGALENAVDLEEIDRLEAEFRERFGESLSGLPQMKALKKAMDEAYHGARTLRDELEVEKEEASHLQEQIASLLRAFTGRAIAAQDWREAIRKLNQFRDRLQEELQRERLALAALGVDESDVYPDPAPVAYSRGQLQTLRQELGQTQATLAQKTDELRNLKQRVSEKTGDPITLDWETLIHNLQRKRHGLAAEYREITAQILAGILVNEQLEAMRAQEEEKIRRKLASDTVSQPVFNVTRRYSSLAYEEGDIYVGDDYGRFALGDLSTGAREQVLLGLRIGFAAHLLRQDRLFLLLDDAFQHADWQRRQWLVEQAVTLAKDGWQIVYFTMDDHIRDIFDAAGQAHFAPDYRYHELNA